jgi:general secretion pathway protein B
MSLILEALRKSEAERRRGEVPSVYSDSPATQRSSTLRVARSSAWVLVACVAVAALWGARALLTRPSDTPRAVHATPVKPESESPAPPLPAVAHLSRVPVARTAPATAKQPWGPAPSPIEEAQTTATTMPAIAEPAVASPAISPPTISPSAIAPPAAAAPPTVAPANDGMLRLSDLDPDSRKALPPLKLSMHMWNSDPSQRFVILDGNRVREGDRVGDAVVTAITSDGVVLDWNGRRLKLPIR